MNQNIISTRQTSPHTLPQSIFLHLTPGILGGAAYFALTGLIQSRGYPSVMALILAGLFVITPIQWGILFFQSRKNGKKLFGEVIQYLDPLPWKDYLIWVPIIVFSSGIIMVLAGPLSDAIRSGFNWLPEPFFLDMGLDSTLSINKLIITYILVLLAVVLIGPLTEEFYFRGYLLPRMPGEIKSWGPILHCFLFAIYHVWTPWFFVARTLAMLPLVYTVRKKKNIFLGAIAHCLLNSIDFFIGLVFIIRLF